MAEKLVIAGRDGGYASALSKMVDAYKAANPGLEVDRLELPYGGLLEKVTISMREKAGAYDVIIDHRRAYNFPTDDPGGDIAALRLGGGGLEMGRSSRGGCLHPGGGEEGDAVGLARHGRAAPFRHPQQPPARRCVRSP